MKDFQAMIQSIAMHNFVHFHEEQRLVFKEGANFLIGGNSTGKTALFELIRRCYSNKINTTTSSVLNENELAYAVCHFEVPKQYLPIEKLKLSKEEHPKDILACIFIRSQGFQPDNIAKGQANGYDCYKVICSISRSGSTQTFAQKFIGSYGCYTKHLDDHTEGCRRIAPDTSAITDVQNFGTKKVIHHFFKIIENDFETTTPAISVQRSFPYRILSTLQYIFSVILSVVIRSKYRTDASSAPKIATPGASDEAIMNSLYLLLEEGYVGVLPMRSIGPLQWTKSKFNHHDSRDKNYDNADLRAEILLELLDNKLVDKKQEKVFHDEIVHPYEFIKLNGKVEVSNTERKDLSPKRLLKTPEGILEGKQLTLILSHKEFLTITVEEPDRGMHPHLIKKMRDLILRKIIGKTVLIITHNPTMLDRWAMERTFVSSKSILNETICHSICKVPRGCVQLCERDNSEEIKNMLFSSRILFVEGKIDKIIVEAIIRLLIHDDKIQNHRKISTKQKHFLLETDIRELAGCKKGPPMKRFCEEMKKEIYLLYDEDAKDKKIEHNKKTTIDEEAEIKTSNADTKTKTRSEGAKNKTCYEDTTMKTSNEYAKKKTSNIDSKKKISYEETKKKISNEETLSRKKTRNEDDKRNTSNEDSEKNKENEYAFYWVNGDLEQRFIDILDDCNDKTVVGAITEIFHMFCEEEKDEYNSIENYLTFRKQIEALNLRIQAFKTPAGNDQTCATAELENLEKDKNKIQKKTLSITKTIKYIVKTRIIPNADYENIETIAEALIHHSKEIPKFIDFCSNNNL